MGGPFPFPGLEMAISFSSPSNRDGRTRGAGVTAVLGPTNTGKTHLAIERMLGAFVGHDRAAAAAARARGLQQMRRAGRRRERRADHRRGEDQAAEPALLGRDRRGDAARSRRRLRRDRRGPAWRRSRARPCLHRSHAQPARPRGDAGARRRDRAADGRAAAAGRARAHAAAAVAAHLRRREEADPAAAPLRSGRVLGRGGLRDRRADPPPARRRRGGAGRAVPAHAQCAGRALPVRRRRISWSRPTPSAWASISTSTTSRLPPTASSTAISSASSIRPSWPDRRPRRPRHPRRHLRHHRPLPAVRDRGRAGAGEPFVRAAQACCNGATPRSTSSRVGALQASLSEVPTGKRADPRAGRRGHPGARSCVARRRRARRWRRRRRRWRGCGRSARSPTTARSRPPPMPSWR